MTGDLNLAQNARLISKMCLGLLKIRPNQTHINIEKERATPKVKRKQNDIPYIDARVFQRRVCRVDSIITTNRQKVLDVPGKHQATRRHSVALGPDYSCPTSSIRGCHCSCTSDRKDGFVTQISDSQIAEAHIRIALRALRIC